MGPLSDCQLSISPVFYYTIMDAWGPLKAYVPGYQKATRAGSKTYIVYMVVFGCAATSTINCQIMEGTKDTNSVLDVLNRFAEDMDKFVPKKLTKKHIFSKFMSIFYIIVIFSNCLP